MTFSVDIKKMSKSSFQFFKFSFVITLLHVFFLGFSLSHQEKLISRVKSSHSFSSEKETLKVSFSSNPRKNSMPSKLHEPFKKSLPQKKLLHRLTKKIPSKKKVFSKLSQRLLKSPSPSQKSILSKTPSSKVSSSELSLPKNWLHEFKTELRDLIDQQKSYPRISRRLGQKGTVVVAFTLLKDGNIINVRIIDPSQYKRLNDSALSAVKSLKKFKPLPSHVAGESLDFEVPIRFFTI